MVSVTLYWNSFAHYNQNVDHNKPRTSKSEEHPKFYERMHVIYQFKGTNLPLDKLEKAVNLSEEKYCGVSALYKKAIPLTKEIRIIK